MSYSIEISGAGPEPVTVGQVRMHTRIDDIAEDALVLDYIGTARETIEQWTGLLLRSCTMTLTLEAFESPILLPRAPVTSITSITYTDSDGDAQTVAGADYSLRKSGDQYSIVLAAGAAWPSIEAGSLIDVAVVAGYGPHDLPGDIRAVLYRMVAHQYDNRGEPGGLEGFGSQVINRRLRWAF